jgi:fluoride exporter
MDKWMYLIGGGMAGTLARYAVTIFALDKFGPAFPYGALLVNVAGCFVMGFCNAVIERKMSMDPEMRLLLMVGFCGAFTTFSAFILDTHNLIRSGETLKALLNVIGSVVLCFIVFRLGMMLGDL